MVTTGELSVLVGLVWFGVEVEEEIIAGEVTIFGGRVSNKQEISCNLKRGMVASVEDDESSCDNLCTPRLSDSRPEFDEMDLTDMLISFCTDCVCNVLKVLQGF